MWDTACRRIIDEFGDTAAYGVALGDCSGFIVVGQTSLSVGAPYLVTYLHLTDDGTVDRLQVSTALYQRLSDVVKDHPRQLLYRVCSGVTVVELWGDELA